MKTVRCKTCNSPDIDLINRLLLDGHSCSCVMWHLYHLGRKIQVSTLENHKERHVAASPHMDRVLLTYQEPGWYYPLDVAPVASQATPELLLIRGIPGSGKSRLARLFLPTHVHLETDQFFFETDGRYVMQRPLLDAAHTWCLDMARDALLSRRNVVVANTFISLKELGRFLGMGYGHGATLRILDIPNPWPWKPSAADVPIPRNVSNLSFYRMRKRWTPFSLPIEWEISVTIEHVAPPVEIPQYRSVPFECSPRYCPVFSQRFSGAMSFRDQPMSITPSVLLGTVPPEAE